MADIHAPSVYIDRNNHTTIVAVVGRKYVAHIPMDSKLTVIRERTHSFLDRYRPASKGDKTYPPVAAAGSYLRAAEHLPATSKALRILEKIAASSTPTEHDLIEEEENPMARKSKDTEATEQKTRKRAKKTAEEPVEEAGPRTIGGFDPSAKIKVLIKENPHREGSKRALAFESAKAAKTVADYEGKPKYLSAWVESGHLQIG